MQDTPRIMGRDSLSHSPEIFHFPSLQNNRRESSLLKEQQFWPVMKTKRYNVLKLYELKHLRDKDRRMGRLSFQKDRLVKLQQQQEQHHQKSIDYYVRRNDCNRKMRNSSFMNLLEKIKQNNRYCSIQK